VLRLRAILRFSSVTPNAQALDIEPGPAFAGQVIVAHEFCQIVVKLDNLRTYSKFKCKPAAESCVAAMMKLIGMDPCCDYDAFLS